MRPAFPILALTALAACEIPDFRGGAVDVPPAAPVAAPLDEAPVDVPQTAKERFLSAAETNGCVVNAETAPAILGGATLSQEDLARILTELRTEGRGEISPDGQGFRVTTGACA